MHVDFLPQELPSGTVSFIRWDNTDLQRAIRQAFDESSREELVRLCVTRDGLHAQFETRDSGSN